MIKTQTDRLYIIQTTLPDGNCNSINAFLKIYAKKFPHKIIEMNQVHGIHLQMVDDHTPNNSKISKTDGLITKAKNHWLMIKTADCLPVILYDPIQHAVAALHAGWQGLDKGIIPKACQTLERMYKTNPQDIEVYIGPCVRACCYAFDEPPKQMADVNWQPYISKTKKKWHVDLSEFCKQQLVGCGVNWQNIKDIGHCTHHEKDRWFSYSRHKITDEPTGLMATIVQLV